MADRKPLNFHVPLPRIRKPLNAIGRKNEVKIERSVLELHKILPAPDVRRFLLRKVKA